ncbi:hypothetical protein JB92DRAFT_2903838 [Gautieria morchelliformis]|nr:hypothetical protein JB92DRAFT_2903838 [Gautieria morchelliformis]
MPPIDNQHASQLPPSSSTAQLAIPKLGQTRCYWTLLSAELEFLYVDPVLHAHLGPQADAIIGRKLLEFVHPDEHASAQQDLGKVLESRTLHGSVTRVRYSRLGRTRARLGYTGVHNKFTDEDKVSFDEDYMACDLVINWAAEGLVLCFIHAVVDMSPQDNDEVNRTHWTNWCGTPRMTVEHGNELYHALFHIAPHVSQGAPPPTRVFQILHNSTDRPTLFSWPGEGYIPADYGRLANDVQIGGANGSDAKTSCTRRYKAQQVLDSADGSVRDVESIFIPHGRIIFACHKATPHRPRGHPNSYPLYPTPAQFYDAPGHAQTSYYPPVPVPSQAASYPGHTYSHYSQPSHQSSHPHVHAAQARHHHTILHTWSTIPTISAILSRCWTTRGTRGGNPPVGVTRCAACRSTSSPEWRKGPSGRKDLCNACGLRYSRARAKKEGIISQRRRKDAGKAQAQTSEQGPPSKRRGYASNVYAEYPLDEQHQPMGAGSGEGSTPSPSPPHDYPQSQQSSSSLYSYPPHVDPRQQTMYAYSTQQQHQHGNGFLAPTPSPAPGGLSVGSSSTEPAAVTSTSSYERAGIPSSSRHALGNQHVHP